MSYITKEVSCSKCGYTDRGPHLRILADPESPLAFSAEVQDENYPFLRLVHCPGQKNDDSCGRLLSPRLVFHPYAPRFREGDLCRIHAPVAHQYFRSDRDRQNPYPLGHLHGKTVMVVNSMPDTQNTITIKPVEIQSDGRIVVKPIRLGKKTFTEIPVLQSVLVPVKKEA